MLHVVAYAEPLQGLPPAQANLAVLVAALVGLALAWQSTRGSSSLVGFAVGILGGGVAGAAGWLATGDTTAGITAGGAGLLVAAGANAQVLARKGETAAWFAVSLVAIVTIGALVSLEVASFVAFAAMILFGAIRMITAEELVHATVWLALVLFGVSGLFLVLGHAFLAMIQLLVYVGAVITLILFTVMLTVPRKETITLADIELPPGVSIERVEDLDPETPRYGHGPMKSFTETNPRKPALPPATLYGVSLEDDTYGTDTTVRRKAQKEKEGN